MNIEALKQSTSDSREYDNLRQLPLAIRQYRQKSYQKFDSYFDRRPTDTFLQRFFNTKYPITDREFGKPNSNFCNIFLSIMNSVEVQNIIDDMLYNREWVYHPVRVFEKWHTVSRLYYGSEEYFWLILIFNRIIDPFRALQDFSMVRIPNFIFLQRLPYRMSFDFTNADPVV